MTPRAPLQRPSQRLGENHGARRVACTAGSVSSSVPGAVLAVYGPFNYGGRFTGPGNAAFDAQLRAADPARGLRDVEAVDALAREAGFALLEDRAMPADNRCLVWRRGDG